MVTVDLIAHSQDSAFVPKPPLHNPRGKRRKLFEHVVSDELLFAAESASADEHRQTGTSVQSRLPQKLDVPPAVDVKKAA